MASPETDLSRLTTLREVGQHAVDRGDLDTALACYEEALEVARRAGLVEQIDLALCNRAAVMIAQRTGEGQIPKLREILLRSEEPIHRRLAAYNIAQHYEYVGENKKALFYARIALEQSRLIGRADWIASTLNQTGNSLLAESRIEEATETYERALELMPASEPVARSRILNNLGYCRILQGRCSEGLGLLYLALRTLRRLRNQRYRTMVHLDLCFGLLEVGKYRAAYRHGLVALKLGEAAGDSENQKNALYLLGETANVAGDEQRACTYFEQLQKRFFPDSTYLPEFLLSIDIRNLVNLHA